MQKKHPFRKTWAIITLLMLFFLPCLRYFDQIIFLNRTSSMPKGIYIKKYLEEFYRGEIIVFYSKYKKSNLLKYIAAHEGDEYCLDIQGTLWVNAMPLAEKNYIKYPDKLQDQSICLELTKEEFLVLGEHPDSYDSRYFGPIKKQQIVASVRLLVGLKND